MKKTEYLKSTGEITTVHSAATSILEKLSDNDVCGFILGSYDTNKFYVVNGSSSERPLIQASLNTDQILANRIDTITLALLPIPCTVTVANTVYEVDDGELEISFDTPGEYIITVSSFPYLDKTFTVEAL